MPLVTVEGIEGVFTEEQKHRLIRTLTEAMVEVGGETLRFTTQVRIDDMKPVAAAVAAAISGMWCA
jgi:4-oxalocrotonate tautomerase